MGWYTVCDYGIFLINLTYFMNSIILVVIEYASLSLNWPQKRIKVFLWRDQINVYQNRYTHFQFFALSTKLET